MNDQQTDFKIAYGKFKDAGKLYINRIGDVIRFLFNESPFENFAETAVEPELGEEVVESEAQAIKATNGPPVTGIGTSKIVVFQAAQFMTSRAYKNHVAKSELEIDPYILRAASSNFHFWSLENARVGKHLSDPPNIVARQPFCAFLSPQHELHLRSQQQRSFFDKGYENFSQLLYVSSPHLPPAHEMANISSQPRTAVKVENICKPSSSYEGQISFRLSSTTFSRSRSIQSQQNAQQNHCKPSESTQLQSESIFSPPSSDQSQTASPSNRKMISRQKIFNFEPPSNTERQIIIGASPNIFQPSGDGFFQFPFNIVDSCVEPTVDRQFYADEKTAHMLNDRPLATMTTRLCFSRMSPRRRIDFIISVRFKKRPNFHFI